MRYVAATLRFSGAQTRSGSRPSTSSSSQRSLGDARRGVDDVLVPEVDDLLGADLAELRLGRPRRSRHAPGRRRGCSRPRLTVLSTSPARTTVTRTLPRRALRSRAPSSSCTPEPPACHRPAKARQRILHPAMRSLHGAGEGLGVVDGDDVPTVTGEGEDHAFAPAEDDRRLLQQAQAPPVAPAAVPHRSQVGHVLQPLDLGQRDAAPGRAARRSGCADASRRR